jgi:hypothetical protein
MHVLASRNEQLFHGWGIRHLSSHCLTFTFRIGSFGRVRRFSDLEVRASVMALFTLTGFPCFSLGRLRDGRYRVHRQAFKMFPFDHNSFSFYAAEALQLRQYH